MTDWLTRFNDYLNEIEAGRIGFVSLPDLRREFGTDFTTNTVKSYIRKNRPALEVWRQGKYGWCVGRRNPHYS